MHHCWNCWYWFYLPDFSSRPCFPSNGTLETGQRNHPSSWICPGTLCCRRHLWRLQWSSSLRVNFVAMIRWISNSLRLRFRRLTNKMRFSINRFRLNIWLTFTISNSWPLTQHHHLHNSPHRLPRHQSIQLHTHPPMGNHVHQDQANLLPHRARDLIPKRFMLHQVKQTFQEGFAAVAATTIERQSQPTPQQSANITSPPPLPQAITTHWWNSTTSTSIKIQTSSDKVTCCGQTSTLHCSKSTSTASASYSPQAFTSFSSSLLPRTISPTPLGHPRPQPQLYDLDHEDREPERRARLQSRPPEPQHPPSSPDRDDSWPYHSPHWDPTPGHDTKQWEEDDEWDSWGKWRDPHTPDHKPTKQSSWDSYSKDQWKDYSYHSSHPHSSSKRPATLKAAPGSTSRPITAYSTKELLPMLL